MWEAVRWLHLVAMAFFVGGQLVVAAAVVPVLRGRPEMRAVARRFGWGSVVALAVLLATGAAQASHFGQWDDGILHVKLALVLLAGGLIALHLRRPTRHALQGAIFGVSLVIVALGVGLAH